ncbi:MAG: ABC transporter substrate-binding protein, partial [Bacillota bacterium]|nr:ABC transporter substrate-binding protein [Bacillota bacterium]
MKKAALLIFSLILALSLTACGSKEPTGDSNTDDTSLGTETTMEMTIAAMPSIDKIPVIVGDSLGYFEKYGLKVNLENFQSPTDRNAALQAGEVDGV